MVSWLGKSLSAFFAAAALSGTVTVSASNQTPQHQPRLYGSETTLASLGSMRSTLERVLPQWAGMDVLLAMPDDMAQEGVTPETLEAYGDSYSACASAGRSFLEKFGDIFLRNGNNAYFGDVALSSFGCDAVYGAPTALNSGGPSHRAVIITMPAPDHTPSISYGQIISGLTDRFLADLPQITNREWFAAFLLHEAHHARRNMTYVRRGAELITVAHETEADRFLVQEYHTLRSLGLPYNPRIPALLEGLRAISALSMEESNPYSFWPFYFSHHVSSITTDVRREFSFRGQGAFRAVETHDFDPARQASAIVHMNNLADALLASANEHGIIRIPQTPHSKEQALAAGRETRIRDPLLHYAAVKVLREAGLFQKNSAEDVIAREFVRAFEDYIPQRLTSVSARNFRITAKNLATMFAAASVTPQLLKTENEQRYRLLKADLDHARSQLSPRVF